MPSGPLQSKTKWRLVLAMAAAAVLIAYPIAGLYPYRFALPEVAPNTATPLAERGLRFAAPGPGIARTDGAPDWVAVAIDTNRIDIDLRVRPYDRDQGGPARIISLSAGPHHRNFTIGQEGPDLIFRLRTPESDANGKPETRVPGVFAALTWHDLRIVVAPGKLDIEVDGRTAVTTPLPKRPLRNWNRSFKLALGNELTNNRAWLGEISRAVVRAGGRVVDYAEPGLLAFPPTLRIFDPQPRLVPLRGLEPGDAVINLVGFVPLGILLGVWLGPRRRFARGLLVVVLTSAAIEGLQFFIPGRTPAVDDLLLNGIGGALGLQVAGRLRRHYGFFHL